MEINKDLSPDQFNLLLTKLKLRFHENMHRHEGLIWEEIEMKLKKYPEKIWSLNEMEKTGGEPDVINLDSDTKAYIFYDCSKESPLGRRSVCYDLEGLMSRKKFRPENNALDMATEMGIKLLSESEYRTMQKLEDFDLKTSSWLKTPENIRKMGGALFGDKRYNATFVYHNGAQSYYAARGFRGSLSV